MESRSIAIADRARKRSPALVAVRIAALALLLAACIGPHLLSKALFRRSAWPPRFLGACAWIIGARVSVTGPPARPGSLLIANHASWIDILVLSGVTGCAFVSKDELRSNAVIRWLADQNATIYIRRQDRRATASQARSIAAALREGQPLALFPEGTTGPGTRLLPFRSSLLAAVTPPPAGVDVRPVGIDYGAAAGEIGWFQESGRDNILRILGRPGHFSVTVHLLAPLDASLDRKQLTQKARDAIADALASSSAPAVL